MATNTQRISKSGNKTIRNILSSPTARWVTWLLSDCFLTSVLQHNRHAFYRGLVERDDIVEPDFDDDACSRYYDAPYFIDTFASGLQFRIFHRLRAGIRTGTYEKDYVGKTRTEEVRGDVARPFRQTRRTCSLYDVQSGTCRGGPRGLFSAYHLVF